jgi:hypothetical protein
MVGYVSGPSDAAVAEPGGVHGLEVAPGEAPEAVEVVVVPSPVGGRR